MKQEANKGTKERCKTMCLGTVKLFTSEVASGKILKEWSPSDIVPKDAISQRVEGSKLILEVDLGRITVGFDETPIVYTSSIPPTDSISGLVFGGQVRCHSMRMSHQSPKIAFLQHLS